jgi:hypothetical protein
VEEKEEEWLVSWKIVHPRRAEEHQVAAWWLMQCLLELERKGEQLQQVLPIPSLTVLILFVLKVRSLF